MNPDYELKLLKMKRKKWSELEEQTLLTKYSDLLSSGSVSKLKTREKKFKPIAEHVNSVHHLHDPVTFPFKWSWRDVSIKVQNMRHQYLGVKQKIQVSKDEFNWKEGENHWENFLKYREVFGDVELDVKGKKACESESLDVFVDCGDLMFGIDCEHLEEEDEEEEEQLEEEQDGSGGGDENNCYEELGRSKGGEFGGARELGDVGFTQKRKLGKVELHKRLVLVSAQVLELRDVVVKREEKRIERGCMREKSEAERMETRKEIEFRREKSRIERDDWLEDRELELEEREVVWARREVEKRLRLEKDFDEEGRRRMRMEEKREEEELEWRERMVGLQIEHEKQMMQMYAEACQNQMQILGAMARLVFQFFGSANDRLGGGLGSLPSQVLQNLQHPDNLGDNGKPEVNSPSEFL